MPDEIDRRDALLFNRAHVDKEPDSLRPPATPGMKISRIQK